MARDQFDPVAATRQDSDPVEARPSATVVLVRKGEPEPQILMVRRKAGDAFGESYTFPGGVLDRDESAARAFCRGMTAQDADAELGLAGGGLDFYSAAARELFEETGVLLAQDPQGDWAFAANPDDEPLLHELRTQLDRGDIGWAELLRTHDLYIACDALHYFAFWETPLRLLKRWAARFFLAEMPPGQEAQHDGSELTDSTWMTAAQVLATANDGDMKLPFPTRTTLKSLSEIATVEKLLRWANARAEKGIQKIRPVILEVNGNKRFVIPGDPDYPKDGDQ
ncbi:MAG: hypothetical protein ACE5FV_10080 [Woeseia sp.]